MKKIMCVLLSVLMMATIMLPVSAAAETDYLEGTFAADIVEMLFFEQTDPYIIAVDADDFTTYEIYPSTGKLTGAYAGASYDLKSNTLTLNGVRDKAGMLLINGMGADFTIQLKGYNELSSIISNAAGANASVSITAAPAKAGADAAELVLNRTKAGIGGIIILADGTKSVLNVAEDVLLKAYGTAEAPAVFVDRAVNVTEDTVINIEGKTSAVVAADSYTEDYYDTVEAYDAEWDSEYYYDAIFEKDGVYYMAYEYEGLISSTFSLYAVEYDAILDMFVATPYKDEDDINPEKDGFTRVHAELIYDAESDVYAGFPEEEYDADLVEKCRPIFMPTEKETITICEYKGKLYGFYKPTHEDFAYGFTESDWEIYKLTAHPEFGYVYEDITFALEEEVGKGVYDLEDFTLLQKTVNPKSIDYTDAAIEKTFKVNNGGATVEPKAIKNIKVVNHRNGLKVTWTADKAATYYRVYRKTANGSYKAIATIPATQKSYIDRTAKPTETYTYTVKGYNKVGWGAANENGATATHIETPDFTLRNTKNGVKVNWAKVGLAKKYAIYRRVAGTSKWTLIGNTTKAYYFDKTAKSGKTYEYYVRAIADSYKSAYEIEKITFIKAPTLKKLTKTSTGLKLTWEKSAGATEYRVMRKTAKGSWKVVGTTKNLSYTDKTAKKGVNYTYTVRAVKGKTLSGYNTGLAGKR